jgi:hypothetical protein
VAVLGCVKLRVGQKHRQSAINSTYQATNEHSSSGCLRNVRREAPAVSELGAQKFFPFFTCNLGFDDSLRPTTF